MYVHVYIHYVGCVCKHISTYIRLYKLWITFTPEYVWERYLISYTFLFLYKMDIMYNAY